MSNRKRACYVPTRELGLLEKGGSLAPQHKSPSSEEHRVGKVASSSVGGWVLAEWVGWHPPPEVCKHSQSLSPGLGTH